MKYFTTNNASLPVKANGKNFQFIKTGFMAGMTFGVIAVPDELVESFNKGLDRRVVDEIDRKEYEKLIASAPPVDGVRIEPIPDPAGSMIEKKKDEKAPKEKKEQPKAKIAKKEGVVVSPDEKKKLVKEKQKKEDDKLPDESEVVTVDKVDEVQG